MRTNGSIKQWDKFAVFIAKTIRDNRMRSKRLSSNTQAKRQITFQIWLTNFDSQKFDENSRNRPVWIVLKTNENKTPVCK